MSARNTPLVMIHGFRGTHHGLQKIVDHLDESLDPTVPDLPGFGEGETLPHYTLDEYVEWLHRFIQSQNFPEPPYLLGHSFGSIITAAYAAKYPTTIQKLILVNPIGAPALEGPQKILTQLAIFYYWLGRKLPTRLAHQWLSAKPMVFIMSTTMAKTRDKTLRRWIHSQHYTYFSRFHSPASLLESFQTSVENSVRDTASHIPVSTLLIAGDRDDITPLKKQQYLKTLFSDAQLVTIQDVGHLTHYETPEQVAAAIYDFTRSV